jgi:nucleoid-associated protein YgaU
MPPPPGGDAALPPPPGGGETTMPPPPGDKMFPEEPKKEEPKQEEKKSSGGKVTSYKVARHDSLWKIAGKKKVYADSFQWPLLFIANREQIKDPDIIQPSWNLKVSRDVPSDQVANAVQKAKDTGRYSPHTSPLKKLPIDY